MEKSAKIMAANSRVFQTSETMILARKVNILMALVYILYENFQDIPIDASLTASGTKSVTIATQTNEDDKDTEKPHSSSNALRVNFTTDKNAPNMSTDKQRVVNIVLPNDSSISYYNTVNDYYNQSLDNSAPTTATDARNAKSNLYDHLGHKLAYEIISDEIIGNLIQDLDKEDNKSDVIPQTRSLGINTDDYRDTDRWELEVLQNFMNLKRECPLCMDIKTTKNLMFAPCSHHICNTCFELMYDKRCPMCMMEMPTYISYTMAGEKLKYFIVEITTKPTDKIVVDEEIYGSPNSTESSITEDNSDYYRSENSTVFTDSSSSVIEINDNSSVIELPTNIPYRDEADADSDASIIEIPVDYYPTNNDVPRILSNITDFSNTRINVSSNLSINQRQPSTNAAASTTTSNPLTNTASTTISNPVTNTASTTTTATTTTATSGNPAPLVTRNRTTRSNRRDNPISSSSSRRHRRSVDN